MNQVSLLFIHRFTVSSNKMLLDIFSGLARVVSRCISLPLYNVFCVVSLSNMSYNTMNCIFLIGIAVRARSVYLFVPTFVIWIIEWWGAVGKRVSWQGQ